MQKLDALTLDMESGNAPRWQASASRSIERLLAIAVAAFLAADVLLIFVSVLARYLFNNPIGWSEEVARLFLACFTFLGMALAYYRNQHLAILVFVKRLTPRGQYIAALARNLLIVAFSAAFTWIAVETAVHRWDQMTPALGISEGWSVIPMIIGLALMAVFAAMNIRAVPGRLTAGFVALVVVLAILLTATLSTWLPVARALHPLAVIAPIYFLSMAIGLPLGFDLAFAAVAYLLLIGEFPISIVAQRMHEGVNHFVLIAVPFFILTGALMESGGISGRLVAVAQALIGHVRGGLWQVTILSMVLFSGISGSKAADISAVGSALVPEMRKRGEDVNETVAVLSSAGAMAETIPPSLALIVLGSISSLSIIGLFLAGIVPALVIAAVLSLVVLLRTRRHPKGNGQRASVSEVMQAIMRASLGLVMPVLLLGALRFGVATPTEVSAFAVVYAFAVTRFVYREMPFSRVFANLVSSACLTGVVLFMFSSATVLSWVVSVEGIPQAAAEWVVNSLQSKYLFLLLSIVLVIVLGAILEGLPALIILTPLLLPAAKQIGIDPLHFGMVMVISMGVGASAPLIGIGTVTACAVGGTSLEAMARPYIPYYLALILGLLVVAFVPWFTLVIPHSLGF
jgi:tripartite ATP-independent transporter DctM subunit